MNDLRSVLGLVTAILLGPACGGGSGISTGLPRDKQLSTLTAADLKTACLNERSTSKVTDGTYRGICAAIALDKGEAACNASLDACVAMSKQANTPAACDAPAISNTMIFAGCTATVGDFEDCLNAVATEGEKVYGSLTCTSPPPSITNIFLVPGCASFNAKCPIYVGLTAGSDMGGSDM